MLVVVLTLARVFAVVIGRLVVRLVGPGMIWIVGMAVWAWPVIRMAGWVIGHVGAVLMLVLMLVALIMAVVPLWARVATWAAVVAVGRWVSC